MNVRKWKKGCLHCHTLWSDGRSLPEMVLRRYRDDGYDFVCLSDHNLIQNRNDLWLPLHLENNDWPPDLSYEEFQRTESMLPGCVETKQIGIRTFVHLKPFKQLKNEFEEAGRFLVIPGEEITIIAVNFGEEGKSYDLHLNIFNLEYEFSVPREGSAGKLIRHVLEQYAAAAMGRPGKNSFLMLNHPFYRVWDVDPRLLIDFPEIRIFEICNCGSSQMPEDWICDREKYWDFILAHRLKNGKSILYGAASDDAHFYDSEKTAVPGTSGTGWIMVDCPKEFTPEAVSRSILRGDFYASCGVLLKNVAFDQAKGRLMIEVDPEPGIEYRIDFITTKNDFDSSIRLKEYPMNPEIYTRTRPVIPDDVGTVAKTVNGIKGTYTLKEDDLYVRALITSNKPGLIKNHFYPLFQSAWSQPFCKSKDF